MLRSALRQPVPAALACCATLVGCQAMGPAMTSAIVGFGQDVLASAAQNFAPQYAASVQNLFLAMAETATGVPFTQPAVQAGYDAAAGGYPPDGSYGDPQTYPAQPDGYPEPPTYEPVQPAAYPEPPAYDPGQPAYDPGQPAYQPVPPAQDPGQAAYGGGQPAYGPGQPASDAASVGQPVALEVALLSQQRTPDGQVRLAPVNDGDVLRDGRGDPARGDKIKIHIAANCACYVYVIGIDATGYVAQIFPQGDIRSAARVTPGRQYLVPDGTAWWGLDDYQGIEQIYFIASRERRPDIEAGVAQLAGRRAAPPAAYRAVREPAIVPVARGLVQVQSAAPTMVANELGAAQPVTPTLFQATVQDADLVITRWFRHE